MCVLLQVQGVSEKSETRALQFKQEVNDLKTSLWETMRIESQCNEVCTATYLLLLLLFDSCNYQSTRVCYLVDRRCISELAELSCNSPFSFFLAMFDTLIDISCVPYIVKLQQQRHSAQQYRGTCTKLLEMHRPTFLPNSHNLPLIIALVLIDFGWLQRRLHEQSEALWRTLQHIQSHNEDIL